MEQNVLNISPEKAEQIKKGAHQLIGYAQFLKWTTYFPAYTVSNNKDSTMIKELSVTQSNHFSFALNEDVLYLGVQKREQSWLEIIPFSLSIITDRLYLIVDSVQFLDKSIPNLGIGIFIDSKWKVELINQANYLQFIEIEIKDGEVKNVGQEFGEKLELIKSSSVLNALNSRSAIQKKVNIGDIL